jgi:hypothetical protein
VAASKFFRYTSTRWLDQDQPAQPLDHQLAEYTRLGFAPDSDPAFSRCPVWMTAMVAFNMRHPLVTTFLDTWYLQTLRYTTQDQVGFPYAVHQLLELAGAGPAVERIVETLPNAVVAATIGPDGKAESASARTRIYVKRNHSGTVM